MSEVKLNLEIPKPAEDEEDATNRQKQYIRALLRETGSSGFPEDALQDLGKWQASSIIDQLQDFKKQLRGEMPLNENIVSGLDDDVTMWTKDVGMPLLYFLAALVILWLIFS